MQNILLFIDLDDTLFQTHRKNPDGAIPATYSAESGKGSYMTKAQYLFFELFKSSEKVKVIPTTARDFRQYNNTLLSTDPRINTAILYFAGAIFEDRTEEKYWQQHIQQAYRKLELQISQMLGLVKNILGGRPLFSLYNVDNYYITIKAKEDCPLKTREEIFTQLKTLKTSEYFVHQNDRALSLVPNFLDKRYGVEYLIDKYKPELTLGVGDSFTDWGFMQQCDFRIIPKNTQIETVFRS